MYVELGVPRLHIRWKKGVVGGMKKKNVVKGEAAMKLRRLELRSLARLNLDP